MQSHTSSAATLNAPCRVSKAQSHGQAAPFVCRRCSSSRKRRPSGYLGFDDVHEAGHELRALQQKVEVVKDDGGVPERRGRQGDSLCLLYGTGAQSRAEIMQDAHTS